MQRGVVFTACELLQSKNGEGFQTGRWITQEEINYFVLYWDRLVSPTNQFIHLSFNGEDELVKCGILSRPRFAINGMLDSKNMPEFHSNTHTQTLNILRGQKSHIDWRMHFLNQNITIHPELAQQKEVVRFEIGKLLPVPTATTPLHEILEFKEKRSDELKALHGYLDELYQEVLAAGDFNLQKATALAGLMESIQNLNTLNDRGWRSPLRFDFSSSFEFDFNQLYSGAITAIAAFNSPHPLELLCAGTAVTALGGFIKVKPQIQSVLKGGDPKLAYLTEAKSAGLVM
ncbi:DUF6236 family protein [Buttiauxella noackiae]|uniref:DUF6236 family protein n=1 Tax=Buttiauxella noackiae TaxID=82992 RepID=UPI0035A6E424